jgi:uncharacterized membrane protein (UPF0127 family)
MRKSTWVAAIMLCTGAAFAAGGARAQEEPAPEPLSAFPQSLLAIRTVAGKVVNFKIWTADNRRREEQGLMFVHEMDEHAGMLFVFAGNQRPTMWMKNTYISLDLLFINEKGRIENIVAQAKPLSLSIIQPPNPALAVLELKGGASELLGIKIGDSVVHPIFHNAM